MPLSINEKDGKRVVKINGAITVYDAMGLHRGLLNYLETNDKLVLDLAAVKECDAEDVQLISSAIRSAKAAGKTFVIENASESVKAAARRAGVAIDAL
ncbi:MAG: STAS domain-containing protein [Thermodesulfobacteriota bacterium]|nr:STAS domain-containing protein [Thermodesulfobacteriota bacterium]